MFRVGQKVVCVDDVWKHPNWIHVIRKPVAGSVYTIRAINPWWADGDLGVLLHEIINDPVPWKDADKSEAHFWIARFRPVVSRKTDISIFEAMLTPAALSRARQLASS